MRKGTGFNFFNCLSGTISIKTSEKPQRIGNLLNLKSTPTSKLLDVSWVPNVYQRHNDDEPFRDLADEEWNLVVYDCPSITLGCSISNYCGDGRTSNHQAPNGKHFTVRDMVKAVCENQKQTRGATDWFGGIDVHHIFFEGINNNGIISWGS